MVYISQKLCLYPILHVLIILVLQYVCTFTSLALRQTTYFYAKRRI